MLCLKILQSFRLQLTNNLLFQVASQVAALDLGYQAGVQSIREKTPRLLYLMGADAGTVDRSNLAKDSFVIYQGEKFPLLVLDI